MKKRETLRRIVLTAVCVCSLNVYVFAECSHEYKSYEIPAGCETSGRYEEYCTLCGAPGDAYNTPPLGHDFDAGTVTVEPAYRKEGVLTRTCTRCGKTRTESIPALVNPFLDVEKRDYFFDSVLWAVNRNITLGMDALHFSPNEICSRGQTVTFLWRYAGRPEPKTGLTFSDVEADAYYAPAVAWACENQIIRGMGADRFAPEGKCTRGQVVTMLRRMAGNPGFAGKNPFEDVKETDYFYEAAVWAAEAGITMGMEDRIFGPEVSCTRAQIVTFLYRYHSQIEKRPELS